MSLSHVYLVLLVGAQGGHIFTVYLYEHVPGIYIPGRFLMTSLLGTTLCTCVVVWNGIIALLDQVLLLDVVFTSLHYICRQPRGQTVSENMVE